MTAIYEQALVECSDGYRPGRGALEAVRDLPFDLPDGRYGDMGEVDVQGFFDHLDHTWLLAMLRVRLDDRAFLHLLRTWLKAGVWETAGPVVPPEIGTPQGGTGSPVLAHASLPYALDLWCTKGVRAHCRGEAWLCRSADDWVCAFRYQADAERFSRGLPKRLEQCNLQVAPEQTRLLRCSRFHPGMRRRVTFLGCECYWRPDRHGVPRVTRRTARKKLQAACRRIKAWLTQHRHLPGRVFFQGLNARLRGHDHYDGVRGTARAASLLQVGDGLYVQMAQPARRQAQEVSLGAVHSDPRPGKDSTSPSSRSQTTKSVGLKAPLCPADASPTEEPEAGKRHVRDCTGGAG